MYTPVPLVKVKIASTGELYPMMPPGPVGGEGRGLGPGGARDEAIVAASREREKRPPRDWGVQEVRTDQPGGGGGGEEGEQEALFELSGKNRMGGLIRNTRKFGLRSIDGERVTQQTNVLACVVGARLARGRTRARRVPTRVCKGEGGRSPSAQPRGAFRHTNRTSSTTFLGGRFS